MSQTSYSRSFDGAFAGQLGDTGPKRSGTYINDQGADIPAGVFVAFKSESAQAKLCDLPADAGDEIAGIALNSFARDPDSLTGTAAIKSGNACNVLEWGSAYVVCEETMAVGDDVYTRITSDGGSNTVLGRIRNDSDSGKCVKVPGARVLFGGTTTQPALIFFDAAVNRANEREDESELMVTLSAAAEVSNSITVTGTITDRRGKAVAVAQNVLITALAVTAGQGALTDGGDGTLLRASAATNAPTFAWMSSTAAGSFQVAVANTAAETTLVTVQLAGARIATLVLTYA